MCALCGAFVGEGGGGGLSALGCVFGFGEGGEISALGGVWGAVGDNLCSGACVLGGSGGGGMDLCSGVCLGCGRSCS